MKNNITEFFDEKLRERYFYKKHESGLDIYIFPKKMTSSYALLGVNFGSLADKVIFDSGEEKSFPSGVAHFLEHKLFSCEDGSDAFEKFAALGADANAYTSFGKTVYLFSCTENFNKALEQLVDFVCHPYFTEENVNKEKGIIAQEIKMCDDSPYDMVFRDLLYAMYGKCAVSENICGTLESIDKITPEILYECYRLFYRYSNMALVVCGDVDVDAVLETVDGTLPKREGAEPFKTANIHTERNVCKDHIEKKMSVGRSVFELGIKDANISDDPYERLKRDAEMTVLDEIIFSRAGDLYNDMFESGLISTAYSYGYSITKELAFHSVYGELDEPKKVAEKVKSYIKKLQKEGIDKETFARCKRILIAEFIREFDSTDDIANSLLNFVFDGVKMFEYRKMIEGVTYEAVCKHLNDSFCDECFALSVISE